MPEEQIKPKEIIRVLGDLRGGADVVNMEASATLGASRLHTLRHVILPQLAPAIAAAARSGIALIWKIVLVVEFLGRSNGVGFQIHLYFGLFDVAMVLVYALAFVAVMLTLEALHHRGVRVSGVVLGSWPAHPDPVQESNRDYLADLPDVSGHHIPLLGAVPAGWNVGVS